ncbi:1-phosphofructokinase [Zafaria cholistanensis]|uniref:1-phosphofructokinase n=1 Tax=Zafaria cholistanensis TaxID=1682741 RepID=A0A5A7NSM0_9MICC|nr:PfkB family carbohydrate kinase [Zafaria cholistanensis]GER23780.1 1-phosphofructokinase [Zafaria cholistanensis]
MNVKASAVRGGCELAQVRAPGRTRGAPGRAATLPRVVTLTPAPSIDKVYFLDRVQAGEVNRAKGVSTYFAGNGVNVARSLHLAGNAVSAVLPVGREGLAADGCDGDFLQVVRGVEVGRPIRTNVVLVDESGVTTNINALPAPLDPDQWGRLCQAAADEVRRIGADWFVLGGALPVDVSTGAAVDVRPLFRSMRRLGVAVCLDVAVGEALLEWDEDCQPDLVKPNAAELALMTGHPVRSLRDAVEAAALVRARGVGTVLASLGPDGILEAGEQGALWARGPRTKVVNTTGAGDAALAGYLSVKRRDGRGQRYGALRRAVSWGALAVQQETTMLPRIIENPSDILIGSPEWGHRLT